MLNVFSGNENFVAYVWVYLHILKLILKEKKNRNEIYILIMFLLFTKVQIRN